MSLVFKPGQFNSFKIIFASSLKIDSEGPLGLWGWTKKRGFKRIFTWPKLHSDSHLLSCWLWIRRIFWFRRWFSIRSYIKKFMLLHTNVRHCLSCHLVHLVLFEAVIHTPVEPYVFHLTMWEAFSWLVLLFPLAGIRRGKNVPRDGFNVVLCGTYVIASNWLSHILTQDWKMKQYSTVF